MTGYGKQFGLVVGRSNRGTIHSYLYKLDFRKLLNMTRIQNVHPYQSIGVTQLPR